MAIRLISGSWTEILFHIQNIKEKMSERPELMLMPAGEAKFRVRAGEFDLNHIVRLQGRRHSMEVEN